MGTGENDASKGPDGAGRRNDRSVEDVEKAIDAWHEDPELMPLHEFLGWTRAEYVAYVETGVVP